MPLLIQTPPAQTLAAYQAGFADYTAGWSPGETGNWDSQRVHLQMKRAPPDPAAPPEIAPTEYAPGAKLLHLPVDSPGVKALAAGGGLNQAVCTHSRFYSQQPDNSFLACEVTNGAGDTPAQMSSVASGERTVETWKWIEKASLLGPIANAGYELRFLSIPALAFEGLRLKNLGDGDDIVMVLNSLNETMPAGTVFSSTDFLKVAQRAAVARLARVDPKSFTE